VPLECSVLIVGSGPAGLFAADQLDKAGVSDIVIVDKGKPMASRTCPDGSGCECRLCDVLEGEGGAGSFSDGKITLSATRGTHGQRLFTPEQEALLAEVERVIRAFVPEGVFYEPVSQLTALAEHGEAGLRFESYPLLHVGSDGVRQFGLRYSADLQARGVTVLTGVEALELTVTNRQATGAILHERRTRCSRPIRAQSVIVASGLMGTKWLEDQLCAEGVRLSTGPAGNISEGPTWNVAFYDGSQAYWPKAKCLPGVAMRLIQRCLTQLGIRPADRDVDQVFVTWLPRRGEKANNWSVLELLDDRGAESGHGFGGLE